MIAAAASRERHFRNDEHCRVLHNTYIYIYNYTQNQNGWTFQIGQWLYPSLIESRYDMKHLQVNYIYIPVVPARGGAEVALGIYIRPFSSIELACAVRQRSPCVRAFFESGVLFHMSHLKLHFALRTSHCTLHTPHCTLHTSHSTLLTSHCTLPNPHFTLHTSHFTLHSPHFTLLTSHCFLHTPHFTLHSSRPTLHTALFTLHTSSHLSSSHLIPAHLFSSHLFSYNNLSFHFIWFHVFPYVSYVLLGYFHVIWAQLKLSHALELLSTYLGASARQQGWA